MAKSTLATVTESMIDLGVMPVSDGAHVFVLENRDFKLRVDCYIGDGTVMYKIGKEEYKDTVMSYSVTLTDQNKSLYSTALSTFNTFPSTELKTAVTEAVKIFERNVEKRYNTEQKQVSKLETSNE